MAGVLPSPPFNILLPAVKISTWYQSIEIPRASPLSRYQFSTPEFLSVSGRSLRHAPPFLLPAIINENTFLGSLCGLPYLTVSAQSTTLPPMPSSPSDISVSTHKLFEPNFSLLFGQVSSKIGPACVISRRSQFLST